jgi:hypothetical protein
MCVVYDDYQKAEEEKLVFIDGLTEFAVRVEDAEADAHDDVLEDAREVQSGVPRAGHTLRVASVAGVCH